MKIYLKKKYSETALPVQNFRKSGNFQKFRDFYLILSQCSTSILPDGKPEVSDAGFLTFPGCIGENIDLKRVKKIKNSTYCMSSSNPVFQMSDAVTSRRFCLQIPIHKFIKLMFNCQTSALITNINFKKHAGRIFITLQVRLSNTSLL